MILCIPASEAKGLDSAFEASFNRAVIMVIFDMDTREVREVPTDPAAEGNAIPAYFHAVLCSRIRRDVWRYHLQQGVRFFGVDAMTVGEAVEKYRKGDLTAIDVTGTTSDAQSQEDGQKAMSGCACGGHGHRPQAASHACCGVKGHDRVHGACGGRGRRHGGCGCG